MSKTPMTAQGARGAARRTAAAQNRRSSRGLPRRSPKRVRTATSRRTPNTTPRASSRVSTKAVSADIEGKLSNAEIIDVTKIDAGGKVIFGATVDLLNVETDEEVTYQHGR